MHHVLSTSIILSKGILKRQQKIITTPTITTLSSVINSSILFQNQQQRNAHTVPLYLLKSVPNKGETGQIINVKAGYARNYLLPNKYAIYATEENLKRIGIDNITTKDILNTRLKSTASAPVKVKDEAEAEVPDIISGSSSENENKLQADILMKYLKDKPLTIWRNIDPNTKLCHPGMVDIIAIREKISKQLKIDLDDHETIFIKSEPVYDSPDQIIDPSIDEIIASKDNDDTFSKDVQLKRLGAYVCKICLAGGYDVPLTLIVKKR